MDRLNAALAHYLLAEGHRVDLVSHRIDHDLAENPCVRSHLVGKTAGSFFLGQFQLDLRGRAVAQRVSRNRAARVLVNGVNCGWSDINWVHFVNHAWPARLHRGPLWQLVKSRLEAALTLYREPRLPRARLLIANSERTRRDLIERVGVPADRIVIVYPGLDETFTVVTPVERAAARQAWGISPETPVAVFVGGLGHDDRKGFATLWAAWEELCRKPEWNALLLVAGGGRALDDWRQIVASRGLASRVRLLGFTSQIKQVLAASDLLVSPVRYETYGLNVHEAICRGLPAIVSSSAGVAERYPAELADLLLPDPLDSPDLIRRLVAWRSDPVALQARVRSFRRVLSEWTATSMARAIVAAAGDTKIEKERELAALSG
jgi:glycosyltransferase involved in cell wall biosynthesis